MAVTVRLNRRGLVVDDGAEPDVVLRGSYGALAAVLTDPDSFLDHVERGDLTIAWARPRRSGGAPAVPPGARRLTISARGHARVNVVQRHLVHR